MDGDDIAQAEANSYNEWHRSLSTHLIEVMAMRSKKAEALRPNTSTSSTSAFLPHKADSNETFSLRPLAGVGPDLSSSCDGRTISTLCSTESGI